MKLIYTFYPFSKSQIFYCFRILVLCFYDTKQVLAGICKLMATPFLFILGFPLNEIRNAKCSSNVLKGILLDLNHDLTNHNEKYHVAKNNVPSLWLLFAILFAFIFEFRTAIY